MTEFPSRRRLFGAMAALCGGPAFAAPPARRVVTILGDSLTAGYGLQRDQAIPAQLEKELARLGVPATVRAAGVSGDMSADGLARVGFSVKPDTDLCLVMLGGNDLLQGIDPKVVRANLTAILRALKARHLRAMLVAVTAPPQIGASYARDFNEVAPQTAKREGVPVYEDLLGKVRENPSLMQADGVHPNPQGVKVVVAKLATAVAAQLKAH